MQDQPLIKIRVCKNCNIIKNWKMISLKIETKMRILSRIGILAVLAPVN